MPSRLGQLRDHLRPGLDVIVVGINPGLRSAVIGHHYAGHSNRFWKLLAASRLVPEPLTCLDDWRLPTWGIGLTNLVARPTGGSGQLLRADLLQGRRRLVARIRRYRPRIVAVLGISLVPVLFPGGTRHDSSPSVPGGGTRLGFHRERFAGARVFVLPNPSGRNAHYSYGEMLSGFRRLRRAILRESGRNSDRRLGKTLELPYS